MSILYRNVRFVLKTKNPTEPQKVMTTAQIAFKDVPIHQVSVLQVISSSMLVFLN